MPTMFDRGGNGDVTVDTEILLIIAKVFGAEYLSSTYLFAFFFTPRRVLLLLLPFFGRQLSALSAASAEDFHVDTDDDFESACLKKVQAGDTCYLADGDHYHDGLTRTHGTESKRITIKSANGGKACIRGSNTQDRVLQIAHNYYTIEDLCFDGDHGDSYVATAIYVLGEDEKKDLNHNGVTVKSSVTGLQLFDLEIKNFSSECVHFR